MLAGADRGWGERSVARSDSYVLQIRSPGPPRLSTCYPGSGLSPTVSIRTTIMLFTPDEYRSLA